MKFPFLYELTIEGVVVALIEGNLVIEADDASRNRGCDPEWTVEEIELDGACDNPKRGVSGEPLIINATVDLADTHWLHDRLLLEVLKHEREAIDAAWAAHLREARATARRGFLTIPPAAPINDR